MTERDIDTAIDRAVRELMDVDTDAAFRARVTARLHRPARRLLLPRLAAAALTVAAMAAAVIWMRPSAPGTPASAPMTDTRGPVAVAPPRTETVGSDRGAVLPTTAALSPTRSVRTAAEAIPRGAVVATVADAAVSALPGLTAIDPIEVEPISQTSIVPSAIVVAPLTPISEMQISPLEPPTARH
jgi:hypothetical protein